MNQQTVQIIKQSVIDSQEGRKPFPEIVADPMAAGVSRYQVDFQRAEKTCYLQNGESHVVSIEMPELEIAEEFHKDELAKAIKASQTEGQKFPEFLKRAFSAGCIGYVAYLSGGRVIYSGKNGDQHTEHFPD